MRRAHDDAVGVRADPQVPRLVTGPSPDHRGEVLQRAAVAPLAEGVLDGRVEDVPVVGAGLADRVAVRQRLRGDLGTLGQLEVPGRPPLPVAARLQEPVGGAALRHLVAEQLGAPAASEGLEPVGQRGADAPPAFGRQHPGVAEVRVHEIGVGDQPALLVEGVKAAEAAGGEVVRRALPLAEHVVEVDVDGADVVQLLGGDQRRHVLGVVEGERAAGEAVGEVHEGSPAVRTRPRFTQLDVTTMPTFS